MIKNKISMNLLGPDAFGNVRTIKEYMEFADIESFERCKLKPCAKAFRRYNKRELLR